MVTNSTCILYQSRLIHNNSLIAKVNYAAAEYYYPHHYGSHCRPVNAALHSAISARVVVFSIQVHGFSTAVFMVSAANTIKMV